jgi:hypothetical protein
VLCHAPPYTSLFRQHKRHNTRVTPSRIAPRRSLPERKASFSSGFPLHGVARLWLKVLSPSRFGMKPIGSALASPH